MAVTVSSSKRFLALYRTMARIRAFENAAEEAREVRTSADKILAALVALCHRPRRRA